jgi:TatD DNase family protein
MEAQKMSFRRHLEIALKLNKPLTIHSRDPKGETVCTEEVLKMVSEVGKGKLRGSFHSYTGETKYVKEILDLGFHIGVNGIVTYPSAQNVRDMVMTVPNDRILFETDCPLLPPQSVRENKELEINYGQPSDVKEILEFVAKLKEVDPQELEKVTDRSFTELFLSN